MIARSGFAFSRIPAKLYSKGNGVSDMCRLFLFCILFLTPMWASAEAVTLELANQTYDRGSSEKKGFLSFALTLDDAVLAKKETNFVQLVTDPGTNFGLAEYKDFLSVDWNVSGNRGMLTPTTGSNTSLFVDLVFKGLSPSGRIRLTGQAAEFSIVVSEGLVTGNFASDFDNCNSGGSISTCSIKGNTLVTSVKESTSIFTVASALIIYLVLFLRMQGQASKFTLRA